MSNIGYEDPSLNNANSLLNTDIPVFDNASAIAAGLVVGTHYRTGDLLKIVH